MLTGWIIFTVALVYLGLLFAIAYFGDRRARLRTGNRPRPAIYALALAVFCTSWTFFGSVGQSAKQGFDFLPVYLGPILMFTVGLPLIRRVVRISKAQNITSIADFMAARYGKSQPLAATVAIIAIAGVVPYISLQLQAISTSVTTLLGPEGLQDTGLGAMPFGDVGLIIAVVLAAFAVLFGTRHIDATEHQHGLMLAIATESVVKLIAFLAVGLYVTFGLFGGIGPLLERAFSVPAIADLYSRGFRGDTWVTMTFLSFSCILLLPRQFHVTVVENHHESEIRRAAWLFPLYLVAINLFVVPIALAGLLTFPPGSTNPDMFVLTLPMSAGADTITLIAFIGGLSAATAMVIVASVALSIMVSNGIALPLLLGAREVGRVDREDMGRLLLIVRRGAIFLVLMLGYLFYRALGDDFALASIGLLAFAAIAQFAPAFFGGLVWRGGTAAGAMAGVILGFAMWCYTLLLPWVIDAGWLSHSILDSGPLGLTFLRPQMLFNFDFEPIAHGVVWSLAVNIVGYVGVSLLRPLRPVERLQATLFAEEDALRPPSPPLRMWRSPIAAGELQRAAARYLGEPRAERAFTEHATARGLVFDPTADADIDTMRFTEHALAGAIGAASSRLVLSLLLSRHNVGMKAALELLDDASEAIHYNRDLMQSALDQVRQGISVFDEDMRLICWNRQFRDLLDLPGELVQVGASLYDIIRFAAARGDFGDGSIEQITSDRLTTLANARETFQERLAGGRVIEVRTNAMPQGGIVAAYTDITDRVEAAEALSRVNETLERRVKERTSELMRVNRELARAKLKADEASLDKTRFLAAASHDILQPLNAARLYATSLVEQGKTGEEGRILRNVDASLESVEEILNTLLDISRLDTGALIPERSTFRIGEILDQLKVEFEPLAGDKGLSFRVVGCSRFVNSDRQLLRRVLQNLVSNALKYTGTGRVLLGCRRRGGMLSVEVYDTGPGIARGSQELVFKEFQRLPASGGTHGLGLGLSIVQRIGRVLDHPIGIASEPGRGSKFSVAVPMAETPVAEVELAPERRFGDLSGMIVLCIDNNAHVLDGMDALLGQWNCRALKARSRAEALQAIATCSDAPDIILADYHLDAGTGVEAVLSVREQTGNVVPAAILTADRSREVEAEVRAAGLQILRKPLKPAGLRALMAQARLQGLAAE